MKKGENLYLEGKVSAGSHKKGYWECPQGHQFVRAIRAYLAGSTTCPYCSKKKPIKGVNDLGTTSPLAVRYWNKERNPRPISDYMETGKQKVWWKCPKEHEWERPITDFLNGQSLCPYCENKKLLKGFNDFTTLYSGYKYQPLDPKLGAETFFRSVSRTVWVCPQGHQWEQTFYRITVEKRSCPYCLRQKVWVGGASLASERPDLAKELCEEESGFKADEVFPGSTRMGVWKCEKGHVWKARCNDRNTGYGCRACSHTQSRGEQEIFDFITSIYPKEVVRGYRLPNRKEIDIYIPDLKIGIEHNGVLWHSEKHKNPSYHAEKLKACTEEGITLIQIWEDTWEQKQGIVKNLLAHKLKVSKQPVTYARETTVTIVPSQEAFDFLNENHIQGAVNGSWYLGLRTGAGSLVALTVLRKRGEDLEMARYATSRRVPGGFQKLVSHIEKSLNYRDMYTFADLEISKGELYRNNGWVQDKKLAPDYKYLWKAERHHKFKFRKAGFKKNPLLKYEEGLTEKELAELNGILRVYDSGKLRFKKRKRKSE